MSGDRVDILEEGRRTEKAVLCLIRIRLDGKNHRWETWIPQSVIEGETVAEWFQEKLVERLGQEWLKGTEPFLGFFFLGLFDNCQSSRSFGY